MSHPETIDCVVVDSGIHPLISVVEYCDVDGDRLVARTFGSSRLHSDLIKLCNRHGISPDTDPRLEKTIKALGTVRSSRMWNIVIQDRHALRALPVLLEENVYERKFSKLMPSLVVKSAHPVVQDDGVPAILAIGLVMLCWPFEDLQFSVPTNTGKCMWISSYVVVYGLGG